MSQIRQPGPPVDAELLPMTAEQPYPREARDPHCALPAKTKALMHSAPWRRVIVVGDSVALGVGEPLAGYRDLDGTGRVVELLGQAHPSLVSHNLGERDLCIAAVRERQLGAALDFKPDLAIVAAGGNDVLARSFDERHVSRELTALVEPLVDQGADLITIGLFDLARSGLVPQQYAASLAERFDRLDALTARIAAEHGGKHADNHHHPLAADRRIFANDRIHCNARGHAIAAVNLVKALLATGQRAIQVE